MIVCQCNALSDRQILAILNDSAIASPSSPAQLYGCLGCKPECGRCVKEVRRLMKEHRTACDLACALCPVGHVEPANDAAPFAIPERRVG
jgi:bacterioferritin-associated ferredoxin